MTGPDAIRVMIVDDHAVVRSGLSAFLLAFDDLEYVGDARGGAEAVQRCRDLRPDVILMDVKMPVLGGAEATRRILAENPDARVLALTIYDLEEFMTGMMDAGALGFLLKDCDAEQLTAAIRRAAGPRNP